MFNFEKLDVWKKSIRLASAVYTLTKPFPAEERFGLANQMRRAAVSVSSNLAEGCSRASQADYRRFVEIATGSAFELVSQARIALDQRFISPAAHDELYGSTLEIVRMLSGLRKALRD